MAFKVRSKKANISRVVAKIVTTVIALYVGGTLITQVGNVMNGTTSPFYQGLSLIGWTVGSVNGSTCSSLGATYVNNTISSISGSGILSVIGIVGIASIVTEFVTISW